MGTRGRHARLCQVILDNIDYWEEPVDRPPYTLKELQEQLHTAVRENGPETDGFLYEMISPKRYGTATPGTLRLRMEQDGCGLWYACFAYESTSPFQTREWMDLHKRCSHPLMVALRASEDLGGENGEIIFTAGGTLDNWDSMLECWMWLMEQYECGYPPEEAVARLDRLQAALEAEEYDMSVDELLGSCERNLSALAGRRGQRRPAAGHRPGRGAARLLPADGVRPRGGGGRPVGDGAQRQVAGLHRHHSRGLAGAHARRSLMAWREEETYPPSGGRSPGRWSSARR